MRRMREMREARALRMIGDEVRDAEFGQEMRRARSLRAPAAESMARAGAEGNRRRFSRFNADRPGLVSLAVPRYVGQQLVDFAPIQILGGNGRLRVESFDDPARDQRVRALVIEQKSLKLRNEARNNFAWYQVLMILLVTLAFNILPLDVSTKAQAANALSMKQKGYPIEECGSELRPWFIIYCIIYLMKYLVSLINLCQVNRANHESLQHIKESEKASHRFRRIRVLYINPIFVFNLIAGNVVYFRQDPLLQQNCVKYSEQYANLSSFLFLIFVFGYG